MRDISKANYDVKVKDDDSKIVLQIESSTLLEDDTKLEVSLISPDYSDNGQGFLLKQVAPKRFISELKDINPGTYNLKISRVKDGKVIDLKTKGLLIPEKKALKPLEYAVQGNNISQLKNIAEITGGKYNPKKEEIRVEEQEIVIFKGLADFLIPLALFLFIIDIAVRKFNRRMADSGAE